ncbi:MAG: CapA family protein [Candidatus Gracilibacteria bacterium]
MLLSVGVGSGVWWMKNHDVEFQENFLASFTGSEGNLSRIGGTKESNTVTLVAFGDMMLDRYVWTLMQRNGLDYPFVYFPELLDSMLTDPTTQERITQDFLFANLEGPISNTDYVNPGTAMIFNFRPEVVEVLQKYGFNVFNIANNHSYDMGADAAEQTRTYLSAGGIAYFGEAKGITENSIWRTEANGVTLTFIGFNDTLSDQLDLDAATALIQSVEDTSDFTIVSIHWGVEYRITPTADQIETAHAFIDSGADVILGHHPHVVETSEWYNGPDGTPRPIYYSLGNFVFDQYFQQNVQEGLGLTITLKKTESSSGETTVEAITISTDNADSGISNSATSSLQITVRETPFDIVKSQVKKRGILKLLMSWGGSRTTHSE